MRRAYRLACLAATLSMAASALAQTGTRRAMPAAGSLAPAPSPTSGASPPATGDSRRDAAGLTLPAHPTGGTGSGQTPYGDGSIGSGHNRVAGLSPQTTLSNAGQPAGPPLGPQR